MTTCQHIVHALAHHYQAIVLTEQEVALINEWLGYYQHQDRVSTETEAYVETDNDGYQTFLVNVNGQLYEIDDFVANEHPHVYTPEGEPELFEWNTPIPSRPDFFVYSACGTVAERQAVLGSLVSAIQAAATGAGKRQVGPSTGNAELDDLPF